MALVQFSPIREMSFRDLFYLLSAALITYCVLWVAFARTLHPLSKFPGPFWASITRLWYVLQVRRGNVEYVQRNLHDKYGPLVRIAPDELSCADPEGIRKIYPTQDPLTKSEFYTIFGTKEFSKFSDVFSMRDEKLHTERRKIVNSAYTLSTVLSMEAYIDECSELFVQRMEEYADSSKPMNLGEWLQWYAFDVIGELFFGQKFGFMEKAYDHGSFIESVDQLLPVFSMAAVSSKFIRPFILTSSLLNPASLRAINSVKYLSSAARSCVAERRKTEEAGTDNASRKDMLQLLLSIARTKGENLDYGIGEVESEAYVAIAAGSDTTAIAMRACFYYLMKHPDIYQQLQAEIDEAATRGLLSSPIRYNEASKLPLLCATIKEAMRLHPSVGLSLPRIVPKGGLEIAGQYVPPNMIIGMSACVIGYNKDIYGSDAAQFRPSRWLEGDTARMDRNLHVFGNGTRICSGKWISLCEIHKIIPLVLRNFDLQLINQSKEWQTRNYWLYKQTGIEVRVKRRLQSG